MYPKGPICSVKHPTFSGTMMGLPSNGGFAIVTGGGSGGGGCVGDVALGKGPLSGPFFARSSVVTNDALRVRVASQQARPWRDALFRRELCRCMTCATPVVRGVWCPCDGALVRAVEGVLLATYLVTYSLVTRTGS